MWIPGRREPVGDGEVGEIWLRGASVGDGYLNLPEETGETFGQPLAGDRRAEWLRTGDLGCIDGDLLWITGRIKDIIICNGRKISAPEVEWMAGSMEDQLNALASAAFMADQTRGGTAVLIAETRLGKGKHDIDVPSLSQKIRRAALGEWGLELVEVLVVPRGTLARTSSGKIQRQAVATAYRGGAFDGFRQASAEPESAWQPDPDDSPETDLTE